MTSFLFTLGRHQPDRLRLPAARRPPAARVRPGHLTLTLILAQTLTLALTLTLNTEPKQACSAMARGDVSLAARDGRPLAYGVGLDRAG